MRVRANLTGGQVKSVTAFLQASNTDPGVRVNPFGETPENGGGAIDTTLSTAPDVIGLGRTVVQERACLGCHVVEGQGGAVGPSLDASIRRRGVGYVMQKLADPTFGNATSMMPNFGLTREQIHAVASYLATLGRQP
jgi:mono/diheme cytochrome c family protein